MGWRRAGRGSGWCGGWCDAGHQHKTVSFEWESSSWSTENQFLFWFINWSWPEEHIQKSKGVSTKEENRKQKEKEENREGEGPTLGSKTWHWMLLGSRWEQWEWWRVGLWNWRNASASQIDQTSMKGKSWKVIPFGLAYLLDSVAVKSDKFMLETAVRTKQIHFMGGNKTLHGAFLLYIVLPWNKWIRVQMN